MLALTKQVADFAAAIKVSDIPARGIEAATIGIADCVGVLIAGAPVAELPDAPVDYRDRYQRLTGVSLRDCPHCGRGQMVRIESFLPGTLPRGPPPIAP